MNKENDDQNTTLEQQSTIKGKEFNIKTKNSSKRPFVLPQQTGMIDLNIRLKDLEKLFWESKSSVDKKL